MAGSRRLRAASTAVAVTMLAACEYARLLRPNALKQLTPEMVALVNELPEVDHQNEAIVGRLFAHGGLTRARVGADGVMHAAIAVPENEYIWKPAIVVMPRGGRIHLDISNEDTAHHMAFLPNKGERHLLDLPPKTRGRATLELDQPGLYWFGCPVSNHAGRGMLGLVIVKGTVDEEARLDRPRQKRP
ncbi:MAG TPA: MSMEG_3727 family PQQ-associated protein [Candidatus Limnocylindrales bacterium]|nr:MSMEG_3727 family PQQ-associated protein [Candidatus Limnocylindrales bacterium]